MSPQRARQPGPAFPKWPCVMFLRQNFHAGAMEYYAKLRLMQTLGRRIFAMWAYVEALYPPDLVSSSDEDYPPHLVSSSDEDEMEIERDDQNDDPMSGLITAYFHHHQ